ncbi:hypothetical protein FACS189427_13200 [Planctomycetales bacterium]|nr:hypothetical protein FACS189427_13200 [Planctomycetales bacterium]
MIRVNGSASLTDIPQSQQFQIGGQATVRGHDEGLLNGDSGILVTAEARYNFWNNSRLHYNPYNPIFSKQNLKRELCEGSRADVFLFFDNGGVFYRIHPADSGSYDNLASIGTGTLLTLGKHFSAILGYGQPIFTDGASEQYRSTMRHGNFFMNVRSMF